MMGTAGLPVEAVPSRVSRVAVGVGVMVTEKGTEVSGSCRPETTGLSGGWRC